MVISNDDPKSRPKALPKAHAGPTLSLTTADIEVRLPCPPLLLLPWARWLLLLPSAVATMGTLAPLASQCCVCLRLLLLVLLLSLLLLLLLLSCCVAGIAFPGSFHLTVFAKSSEQTHGWEWSPSKQLPSSLLPFPPLLLLFFRVFCCCCR
jgi:hypothetical protein